jgi:hypothetical protein
VIGCWARQQIRAAPVEEVGAMVRSSGMRRLGLAVVLAATLAAAAPAAAQARVLGGTTSDGWPIVVEINKSGKQIVQASTGVTLNCTSGAVFSVPDGFQKMKISKKGKFGVTFGPATSDNPDGTKTVFEGSVSGKTNKARTKASGKWQLKVTDVAATGAVTDTCDSGSVRWRAKD